MTRPDGETDRSTFTAIWKRKDGAWRLQLVRDLAGGESGAAAEGPHRSLEALGWLVGEWSHENKDTKTTVTAAWMRGRKFLQVTYAVHVKGEEALTLTQIIGWDPTAQAIHSWVFDSRGGFGEGAWS